VVKAFIYSLDALIGIIVIVTTIYILSLSQITNHNIYSIMYQAKISAADAIKLAITSGDLSKIIARYNEGEDVRALCNSGIGFYIPITYGYNLSIQTNTESNKWTTICYRSNVSSTHITNQVVRTIVTTLEDEEGMSNNRVINPYFYTHSIYGTHTRTELIKSPVKFGKLKIYVVKLEVFQ